MVMMEGLSRVWEVKQLRGLRTVGASRRKAGGKMYASPRITLDSETKEFIGRKFTLFKGRAERTLSPPGMVPLKFQGDVLILLFNDQASSKATQA